jgi:diguanylate cyclase (GGDEF)-like protein
VSLLVADVDHYQRVVSAFGGAYAQAAFRAILDLTRRGLRQGDLAAHPGGDELLMLVSAGAHEAREVAERLCAAIRGHAFPLGDEGVGARITISIGVASAPEHGSSFGALHAAADSARVRLKAQGRDGAAVALGPYGESSHRPLDIERFAGRAEEKRSLVRWLDEAVSGRPHVVGIFGERGSGTATLVRQVEPEVRLRGGSLVAGRCRPMDVAEPYGVWISLLHALCRLPDPPRRTWRELPQLCPELADPAAPLEAGTGSKYRLLEEIAEYIRLSAAQQPLVLALHEMQWADAASWETIEHLVQQLDTERVLICLTLRNDPSYPEVGERRQTLAKSEVYDELLLSRLTRDDVKRWLEAALHHQEVGREFLAFLYRHSEGNPLFIAELLRTLVDEGALWHSGERWEWSPVSELRLPPGLDALLSRRLARFSASTQAVLSTAAIIGREFDIGLVVAAGAGSEPAVQLALSEALAAGLLRPTYERHGGGYTFAHEQIVEVLVDAVPPDRARQLHGRVAAALDRRRDPRAVEIAMHYDRAGEQPSAYRQALIAARKAETMYAHAAARDSLLLAARNATSPGELAEVRVRLAQLAEISSRFDEAEELCDLAIEWFEGQGDRARALTLRRMRERARKELGQPARVMLDALLALDEEAKELGLEHERVDILMMLSQTYGRLGDSQEAERIASECVRMAERVGDQALLAQSLNRLGITVELGHLDRARDIYLRALTLFEAAGDALGQTRCYINLGNLALHRSDWEEARRSYSTAIALARAAGVPDQWGIAAANLGVISHRSGDYDRARELFSEALGLFATVQNSELQLYALCNMAHIEWESGAWETGAELYEATASLAQRIGSSDVEIASRAGEGLCYLELGRNDAARESYAEVDARLRGRSGWFQGREFAEALSIRLLQQDGKIDEALRRFEEAVPQAEALDVYSAVWLTAVCARSLFGSARSRVEPWISRFAARVDALGYTEIGKQFNDLESS